MDNILIILSENAYIINFVMSGALNDFIGKKNVFFVLSDSRTTPEIVSKSKIPQSQVVGSYKIKPMFKIVYDVLNRIMIRHYKRKSNTFSIKIRAYCDNVYHIFLHCIYSILALPFIFVVSKKILLYILSFDRDKDLEKIINDNNIKLIVLPGGGGSWDNAEIKLANLSKIYNFKTFFLVHNWDNLSSKMVFPILPDYLGVFGPQSVLDAVAIHNMPWNRIFMLGCPRYQSYFDFKPENFTALYSFKYVLFCGAANPVDELTPLHIMDDILDNFRGAIKIIYRPHVYRAKRKCFDIFQEKDFKHVILDPKVADVYYRNHNRKPDDASPVNVEIDFDYFPILISGSLFTISPLSSMILESALLNTPALVLVHDDKYHKVPPSLIHKFKHFEGMNDAPGCFFASSFEEIKDIFNTMLVHYKDESYFNRQFSPVMREFTRKYIHQDERTYAERLNLAVQLIFAITYKQRMG